MNETITIAPSAPREGGSPDLVYVERVSRERSLHVLMQDTAARPERTRHGFLSAAFRDALARYQSSAHLERAQGYLRRTVRILDALSIQVDTRVDDFRDLGLYVLVEEAGVFHLLCARDAPARVRVNGVFVPLNATIGGRSPQGVQQIPIETTRAQHDLFAQTLPDSLVLYRIEPPREGPFEILLGGGSADAAAALDALDARGAAEMRVESDRVAHAMLCARFEAVPGARAAAEAPIAGQHAMRGRARGVVAAALLAAGLVAVGLYAGRLDVERKADAVPTAARATQERPVPVMTREQSVEEHPLEVAAVEPARQAGDDERFELAWQQTYSEPVTSSPSPLGDAIVYGSRDGRVYAVDRKGGEKVWSHTAVGGVGASPLVRGDAVVVADYGGNVYRLARGDGRVVWKRALRERVVSTPAATDERVAVGTSRGNVYALSLETGRVLWRFATRAQVRGGIAHAGGSFFVPSYDGRLYALAADTGRKRWSVALGGPVGSTPSANETRVVVGTAQGSIVAHDTRTGKRQWSFSTRAPVNSAILLDDGRVYAGSGDERVYCLDEDDGSLVWSFETSGAVLSRPFVDDGRVVVTSYDGSVYALDAASGTLVDRYDTDHAIFSSPVVVDNRVYFGNNAGRFFCLELGDS
jgi:outer membrane protein assembly factor BamB